jgi:hypothetical protein
MYNLKISRIIWTAPARKIFKQMSKIFPNFSKDSFNSQSEENKDFFRANAQRDFDAKLSASDKT